MKKVLSWLLVVALLSSMAPFSYAEPHQVIQGTQVRLTLLSGVGTTVSKNGDPFVAITSEPVFLGNTLLIPAGARVNGIISTVAPARHFSVFRGQAYMDLTFRSIEVESRLIPIQMSIIAIEQPGQPDSKRRKDVKIDEGQVIEEKHDYKGDIIGATIGTGGGSLVGLIFSHVARGFGLGLVGGAAYIVARKGKEVELPAQTGLLVRMDNTITVPGNGTADNNSTGSR
ncbi:MAG TPA: hypothetical protein VOA64_16270 [Candidatus Dormibacteraeota bacterium]|nr:hypothetical protein [Candidatus Dormibacteraeota bacterium]